MSMLPSSSEKKWRNTSILSFMGMLICLLLLLSYYSSYSDLYSRYLDLKADYSTLQVSYNTLQENYRSLKSVHDQLTLRYNKLQNEYDNLLSNYNQLTVQYDELQDNYDILLAWEQLRIGTTLETYYDYVRANVLTLGGKPLGEERWWLYSNYYKNSVILAASMAAHDAGNLYWPSLESGSKYYDHAGEYSYQTAYSILRQVLYLAGVSSSDDDVTKIDKIMRFTNLIIHYESRLLDHMWFPTETLTFRSGDCTSFSIFESALFEMVGIKSAIGFFKNSRGEYHTMILVRLDNLGEYGYWYYRDLTSYGLSAGRWIKIEPQCNSLLQQSEQDQWVSQWGLVVVAEVPYGA